jgi:hypothetical protein
MIPVTKPMSWFEPAAGRGGSGGGQASPAGGPAERARRAASALGARGGSTAGQDANPNDGHADVFVRPFIMTEGRTRPLHDGLRMETLVHASPAALSAPLRFEHRTIVELCQRPTALAEVAATLRVPLGVARVLVADLYADNLVLLREPTELPVHVIERIRDLVRAL